MMHGIDVTVTKMATRGLKLRLTEILAQIDDEIREIERLDEMVRAADDLDPEEVMKMRSELAALRAGSENERTTVVRQLGTIAAFPVNTLDA
jgi:hypothetical protein